MFLDTCFIVVEDRRAHSSPGCFLRICLLKWFDEDMLSVSFALCCWTQWTRCNIREQHTVASQEMCLYLQSSRFIDFNKQKISTWTLDKHRLNTDWEKADNCIKLTAFLLHVFGKFPATECQKAWLWVWQKSHRTEKDKYYMVFFGRKLYCFV